MPYDKIDQLYDALKKDGAVSKSREYFRSKILAPGKEGYHNRLQLYNALKADGAIESPTYEELGKRLGLHAVNTAPAPKPRQQKPQATAPQATAPAQQKPYVMSEQDKIRLQLQMGQMKQQVQQGIYNTNAKIGRMMQPLTPKGRERRRSGELQARVAGTPTSVVGFRTAPQQPAQGGGNGAGAASQDNVHSEQSPQPYGVVYENGKAKTQWVLADGSLTTSLAEANQAEYEARTARLARQFQDRMKENGLDPNKTEDVQRQAQLDAEAPMRKVLEEEWQRAEAEDRAADEQYRKDKERAENGSFWDRLKNAITTPLGPDGMPLRKGEDAMRDIHREAKRQDTFNLDHIAKNVFNNLPQAYKEEQILNYSRYFREHPSELKGRSVAQAAKDALQNEVYQATHERAVKANMPKSKSEFFMRKVMDQPFFSQNMSDKIAARTFSKSNGTETAEMDAMGRYGSEHRALDITGTIFNMGMDPTVYFGGYVGSVLGKQALKLGGKVALKGAAQDVAERYVGRTLAGRMAAGMAAGSANFGTFEGLKNIQQQMRIGGTLNPETGEYEFSAGDMLKATGHGMLLGSVTGVVAPVLGNVSDKLVKATESTAGKVGIRAGELMTSTVAEGTIFATPELIENAQLADNDPNKRKAMDIWTDNMAMMLGFKLSHGIKSAPQVIAGLRPVAEPKNAQERMHNNRSFVEKVRKQLDASPRDLDFTKDEREELQRNGYGDLASLFTRTPKQPSKPKPKAKAKPISTDGKVMYLDDGIPHAETERVSIPEFDGYETMERLMQDPNVSQSARAKAYYILTGRMLPMGTITGYSTLQDETGITVRSMTADGQVVTSRKFDNEADAKNEEAKIRRQSELNSIDVGERYKEASANQKVVQAAIEEVAPGADLATVMRNYKAVKEGDKDAIASYGEMMEQLDKAIEKYRYSADNERPEAIRESIKEQTGIDVDKAIRTEPEKRTEEEAAAVEDYIKRLFPEQASEEKPMSEEEAAAAEAYDQARQLWDKVEKGDADAKAEVDAITLRMQEAYQMCEDAFGADAEMRIAEINEDPWPLVNNPELSEDQQDAVLYYVNAKAAMEGVMDASNEAADGKRKEVEANVERHTHKDMGVVQPATMKVDDKPVYVVKGNVVMLPDGSGIDVRNSDQSIVICDAETGEYKFASPDQLFSLGEAIDPQTELDEAYANIQAEHEAALGGVSSDANAANEGGGQVEAPSQPKKIVIGIGSILKINGEEYRIDNFGDIDVTLRDGQGNLIQSTKSEIETKLTSGEAELLDEEKSAEDVLGIPTNDENVPGNGESVPNSAESVPNSAESVPKLTDDQLQQHNQQMLEQEQQRKEEEANHQPTALERVPINEATQEPMFEKADRETALDALNELTGGNEENTSAIINAQVEQATKALEALKKKAPKKKTPALKGSPMEMLKAQKEADDSYNNAIEEYNAQVATAEENLNAWTSIYSLMGDRKRAAREQLNAERNAMDEQLHAEAVAKLEEDKRIAAEKAAEQAEVGTHAVNPKIKEKWDGATKVEGNPNAITLADGSTIRGHYVLTEAGAATASHDVNNAYEPTEGFPVDENGESVNDRDYKRDTDAQRIVRDMADSYDSRALQTPVIVSKDGVVLSGNNRTMSGEIAAKNGTDNAYVEHLREFGTMFGFTPEQIDGMQHPRVVFVPDEELPYDANTFARFNAEQQKKQSKPEHAVKLGKIVPDNVFSSIVGDISRFDRMSDYYADGNAVSSAIGQLLEAGVINEMQLPELRTGNALSAAGKELIENTLIGKVFQASPDAVRQIISTPTLRQSVVMGLNEISNNRTLAKSDYDLSNELAAAVDLVNRAKSESPEIYKEGMPVSPYGRQQGLFDDEYGDSRVTDGVTLILADILNSGKPSDLRKFLSIYNNEAASPASGQLDMFSGGVTSKEELLNRLNEYFRNATPREQQAIVDASVAERKQRAEAAAQNADGSQRDGEEPTDIQGESNGGVSEAHVGLNDDEANELLSRMEDNTSEIPQIELNPTNWIEQFGENGMVSTPLGKVKMGENQIAKLFEKGRSEQFGMIKPTLEHPHVIVEVPSESSDGNTERASSLLFIKTFNGTNGKKVYYFKSVTVKKDGLEVSVSSHYDRAKRVKEALKKGKLLYRFDGGAQTERHPADVSVTTSPKITQGNDNMVWKHTDDVSDASDVAQGLYSSQGNVSDLATEGTDAPQTNGTLSNKEVYNRHTTVKQPVEAAETSQDAEQGDTQTSSSMNVPTSSESKVINNQSNLQETGEKSSEKEGVTPLSEQIATASSEVNTEPTEAQKEAGNYKKGHVQVGTFDITIEQPQGSVRKGTDADGKQWESKMNNTYGYIRGAVGVDGDHIDVFLSNDIDGWNGRKVYVVDQYNPDGSFDEHKVMLGFNEADEAKSDYLANYKKGWEDERRIDVTAVNLEDFEKWIASSKRKTKPFGEYSSVKKDAVEISAPKTGYTITPSTYTNKKGKTSDVSLLTFDHDLTADQERAVKEFTKEKLSEGRFAKSRGWKDRESGGWMFRSEEDARKAAEMVGNEEAVADNQPLTAQELRDAVEPKKPTATNKPATKKPANRVELADVAEQKPSEPTKAEQPKQDGEKKLVITDEMKHDEDILRKLLGIDDDELDGGIKFRDPDAMTSQQRRFVYNAGVNYSLGYIDQGFVAFPEFAKAMVSRLGYKIKPWLKSFYEGAKRIPGYDQAMFTPTEEVDAFDVENFDKPNKDVMAQANMIVEEGKAQVAAEKANNELKEIRNEQRKETEKQTAANTDAVGSKAKSVASEATSIAETSSDEQALAGAAERVDETLDKVNEQLAILGYYEADEVEKDYNESYGYMRNAEKKAVKDVANLASQLIDDLGLDRFEATHSQKTDKKGNRKKKPLAVANIAPIGGDVYMRLPLAEGRELYLTIGVEPRAAKGVEDFGGSDLEVTHIMFRVENPESTDNDRYGRNEYVGNDVTYSELLDKVQRAAYKYIPERTEVADGEYKVGDKVQYSPDGGRTWKDAVVAQPNDEGGIRIDTGLAPALWVNAHPEQLRHKPKANTNSGNIADNPQSWVGRTFNYNGTQLVCNEVDGNYATFDNKQTFMNVGFEVPTVQDYLKSGKFKVEDETLAETKNEDIFQKAERIANEAKAEREKKKEEEAEIMATDLPEPAKDKAVKALHGSASMTDNAALAEARRRTAKKNATKKVKPEQPVGDLFAGLFDEQKENGLQRNDDAVRTETVPADYSGQQQGLRESQGSPRKAAAQKSGRPDGGRGGQSTGKDRAVSTGLHGLTEPKNTRNNHSERGADHAPTSVNGRIEANIKAIELAHELLESGETATPEQMSVLRQFSGWGGLGAAFSDGGYDWKQRERNKKIRELLGEEAYEQAVMSANSAYYTPAYVVDTLWDIADQLGFKGGNILEGSAGIGNILGQMPMTMSERSDIHAIEIDGTSGGILSLLYPDAKVDIQGFEQTRIPNGSVDLAITNVPFVTGLRVNDTTGDSDLSKKFHNIHDFCIAKNVRKLREGGLGIFISSNGTLDNSKALRDWVVNEGGSDFIGAFRMNNKTFGGTTVTSDIIVIRKRVNGQKSAQAIDVSSISGERTAEYEEPGARKAKQLSMDYNKYFIEHPDHMAGEMRFAFEEGDTFRPTSKGLYPVSGKDQGKMLADFVQSFTEEHNSKVDTTDHHDVSLVLDASADGKKLGEMYMKDGQIVLASFGGYYPLEVNDNKIKGHTKQECFTAYAAIKTALADVMKYQTENEDNEGLKPLIAKLNKAYDSFVSTYGHFTKNNQLAWLRNDVDYPNVFSLETYKEQGNGKGGVVKTYDKADVMKGRVVEKEIEPHPENVKDGVVVSMFKNGRIDVPYIANQLGKSEAEVKREIIDSGLGFEDPTTRQMEVSYQYLSGNVREKLKQAEVNNENGEYNKNIKALQDVVPMNIPAHLIDFTLGSSWIDPKLYDEYVKDRTDIDVHFTAAGGTWFMKAPTYGVNVEKNRAMGVVSEMLKKTIMGHELIEAAIQNKSITVSRTEKHYDGTTETITDREAMAACAAKIDEIRQDFKDWARGKMQSDADLSARIEQEYNDRFNNYVPMSIPEDFVPEYFGGATHKFKMRPHQGKAIVRGTMQPLMLAHEVGTGKTFTLISTAMEMRRLGTARKPMIVVQNATVGQFAASAKELYPNAKVLVLDDNDRDAEGRKNFYAKIKYNDWDMVIIPQSTLDKIPDSDERQMQFVQDKIDEKMRVLEQMREADTNGKDPITRRAEKELADLQVEMAELSEEISKKRTANNEKKKAVAKQNAAVKAQEMLERSTDDVENFDDMGIDALLIDEAHEYKHLGFSTAMQRGVKGVDPSYSKKSQGVYLKTQAILEKNNGRNVIFATGTPISNTAAEIWTFMRYLMPKDTMKEYGIYYFDDFVRNFGNIQQMPEFKTNGKFKEVNRFAGYVNLPELVRIWSSVSDTALTKDQTELVNKIPEMEGGKAQDIYLPQTRALRSVMKYVRKQLDDFEQMSGKEKKENSSIPLTMYGIAQRAAVDARLVQVDAEDDPRSKTNEAVRQTLRSLKETNDYKGTVAIFADSYENKYSGFNLYEDIKKKLVKQGIPESEIVVMKSGMKIKQKLDIFDKVNRGEVRVILGSTATLGTGVNIQERLHTLIHLDAPNRPMDYTQRNGRILRQGNLHKQWNKPVRVLRFGVEDSLDVTAYQRLKTKGAIADSVMEGDRLMQDSMNNRVLEEEEDVFGDTVAQLSGSEYALLKNNAEKNVRKYESRRKQWEADQVYIHYAKPRIEGQIEAAEQRAEEANAHLHAVQKAFPGGKFTEITVGKLKFASVDAMADFIKEHNKKILDVVKEMKKTPGTKTQTQTLTLSLGGYDFVVKTEMSRETVNNGGSLFAEIHRNMSYSCPELGLNDVPVKQSLLRNAIEDITENVITGKDFAERVDVATRMIQHDKSELEQVKQREGKPFEFEKELEEAKRQFEEYSEAMKVEMAEKEKKYAEMDASVDAATDVVADDEDEADDGNSKHRMLEDDTPNVMENDSNAMVDRVTELSERLHTPVRIIRTEEEVAALPSARQRRMKGSFNPLTGEVTIVVPNNANMADIENTFVHEVVGHDGLRVLFPDEAKLNNALDELYRVSKDEIRGTIDRMAQKMYDAEVDRIREKKRKEHEARGEDANASYYADMAEAHAEASKKREQFKRDATEEYGADLAGRIGEKGFEQMSAEELTFWGKLKAMLQKALQKLLDGLKISGRRKWSDKEWAFVLHEAYKRKKNGGNPTVFDAADTEVMRRKTGFGDTKFSDGYKKSAKHGEARLNAFQLPSDAGHNVQPSEAALKHLEPTETEHDAKVQQNRENAKEALANVAKTYREITDTKGFLTALKDAMGLIGNGGSAYRSYELPNGDSFVMRVSNHNARAYNVKDGERVESIVIKRKHSPNRFEPANGKIVDEYVYFKEDIRKAPAGTLSSIAESISELLDTGEYHDKTGLARENHSPEEPTDNGMMFRDGDMGLEETITKMKVEASQANADNWQAKKDAMRAIGGNLNKLRQAMSRQRDYDLWTIKSVTDLAQILLDNGLLDDMSKYEYNRILSAVKNVHGRKDISKYVDKVMDIMVDNQLRMGANQLGKLLSIRGSRVDARGIEVQGQLDPEGQRIAQVVRKATSLQKENIEERIADCTNRMSSDDNAVAEEAAIEYSGLLLAHQFVEDITESKAEEKALRESIKEAKADLDAGTMEAKAYREYVESTNDAIRQNKIERTEAYRSIVEQVGGVLGGSVERAKAWREAEKQRVENIHHNANSDMTGRPNDEHHKESKAQKIANNSIVRFVLAPLGTFDQMLRMFGKKSVNGEGYLWNRYMRGWVEATEKEYTGYQNALKTLDEKVSEVFDKKMKWGDLFSLERNLPKATVTFWDGGEQKAHELTQGNLLYIYMVDKMADGRMKLRRMGITEEDVEKIKKFVDPRFLKLADWMQDEFLVEKRNEYNEVHKRMFGASMAAIENYFPLKILANARIEEVDVADDTTDTALPATSTGSIIKRRRNNLALDVMGADAFSVILDHIQQMERWASFAEFNRDLNTLLSYKRFRNQVMNMTSVYGGGKTLWKNFRNVCSMAAGAYRPPIAQLDKAAVNIAKGVTAAKVSFRVFTALKQFLSMPAYLSDSSPVYLAGNIANPIGAWKWSMENLPLFEKRWKSRMAGDPRLMKSEMDWKMWQNRAVEIASRIGMSSNAFVDALTVAIGAHSMYQTKKKKYLRYGYDEETAEKRAKQDATILFNQTQQSSESAFLSTMQTDRSWLSVLFTVFRNSSMSYTRQLYDALRNLKHRFEPGYKGLTEEYLAKQMRRDGIDPDKADQNAKSEYRRSLMRDIVRVGVFGYLLQFAWNLGAYLPYLLLGDDKDEKSDMWHDIFCHTMFGSIEGLTGGDVMSAVGNGFAKGEGLNLFSASKDMPLSSDLQNIVNKWNKDKVAAINDVTNLMVQSGIGVNPQSLTDAVVAIMDYCGDDANTSRECALLITRIINCPQSQIDKIYFDELNATAAEAKGMTPAEIAERYARYKMMREAPLTGWMRSAEKSDSISEKKQQKVFRIAKEKLNSRMETEETKQLLSDYDAVAKQETALSKIKKTDRAAYREGMKQLRQSNDMRQHMRLKRYKHDMNELTSKYLRCKSAKERDSIVSTMFSTRAKMLEDIGRLKQQ